MSKYTEYGISENVVQNSGQKPKKDSYLTRFLPTAKLRSVNELSLNKVYTSFDEAYAAASTAFEAGKDDVEQKIVVQPLGDTGNFILLHESRLKE